MVLFWPIIGTIGLIFRIWLVEFKLKDELEFRKRYVSRILNYYYFIAMILNFENPIFNLLMLSITPILIISVIGWDTLFFKKFKGRTYWKKNHAWLLIERITLHPPIVITSLYIFAVGVWNYYDASLGFWPYIPALILGFAPFFLFDVRWTQKYIAPTGMNILVGVIFGIIGVGLYIYLI